MTAARGLHPEPEITTVFSGSAFPGNLLMLTSREAPNCTIDLMREIASQLTALNERRLPDELLKQVRLQELRHVARQLEASFPDHVGHGERTAHYAEVMSHAVGLTDEEVTSLQYAALLHDIGLLTLPAGLLDEASSLTLEEYVLVQSHPRAGAALLSPYRFLSESAMLIAHHHERWDGAGYPYGLRGTYIPLAARILAIADSFDAIASRSESLDAALRTLRASSGTQFDPALLATFSRLLDEQALNQFSFLPQATRGPAQSTRTASHESPKQRDSNLYFSRTAKR